MNATSDFPRLVVAGMSGDSGKTLLALGLLLLLRDRRIDVRAFKKGPDYIDAAWLSWASGEPARNLDSYLMGYEGCLASFIRTAGDGVNVIEGNRGIFDGMDAAGTHSTAELAKHLKAPVLLVVNATKVTRTVAAWVLGCMKLDPRVPLAGVILNQVSGARHERVIRAAVERECGIPVLGVLPRAAEETPLPSRHLGLVTPGEHPHVAELRNNLLSLVRGGLNLEAILRLARSAPGLSPEATSIRPVPRGPHVTIGYLRDSAFSFYYPENLELLEQGGATLVPLSPITAAALPDGLDALYIGGGFPETHGAAIAANRTFLASLRAAASGGLPVYAECGGLMLLSRGIRWQGTLYPMAEVFPFEVEVSPRPHGHGYVELYVDRPNPFFDQGTVIRGHEFHYSAIASEGVSSQTACEVRRGTGSGHRRDGLIQDNTWASYTHIHALGTPEWAEGLLAAARRRHQRVPSGSGADRWGSLD